MVESIENPEISSVSDLLTDTTITCPYCWESIDIVVDHTCGDSHYVEDCQVCCQPILMGISFGIDGLYEVNVSQENE